MTKGKKILIGVVIVIAIIVIVGKSGDNKEDVFSKLPYPQNQSALINASVDAISKAKTAENDMQKGSALSERSKAICSSIGSLSVTDWVGVVSKIDSNSDGYGVLSVEMHDNIYAKTWNNALSDMMDKTLIKPDTALFNTVSGLKKGQLIKFSGTFFSDNQTCLSEGSLSLDGKLKEPEFIFRFTSVTPL